MVARASHLCFESSLYGPVRVYANFVGMYLVSALLRAHWLAPTASVGRSRHHVRRPRCTHSAHPWHMHVAATSSVPLHSSSSLLRVDLMAVPGISTYLKKPVPCESDSSVVRCNTQGATPFSCWVRFSGFRAHS
jgi:hypothetical protein